MNDMTDAELIAVGRDHAERLLLENGGDLGLVGSNQAYQQVWARDSMLCGLGLLLCRDPEGSAIFRRSLSTLRRYQSPLGKVPHNIGRANVFDPALIAHGGRLEGEAGGVVMDTAHAGCVDGNLWYVVGHYAHYAATGDLDFLRESWPSLEAALLWLRYQDSNECGLLEVHEAMDWADLFVNRYNVLYDNVLYYACWQGMAQLAAALGLEPDAYAQAALDVHMKLNAVLLVGPESPRDWAWLAHERKEWVYTLRRVETELVERPFYLPYVAFRDYADRFDTLGNLLAVLFGVADGARAGKILDYLHGCGLNEPYPVRALYPVIQEGERDWREYYRVRNLNLPHHYHNGGAWPFIGGVYVAALVQAGRLEEAERQLVRLAHMNRQGRTREWEFNEWFHGLSGRPMGYAGQSWSAAMFLYAADAVARGRVSVLTPENGWAAGLGAVVRAAPPQT
jgi:glycogen debranching enzyme